jgi:hypothetical protein
MIADEGGRSANRGPVRNFVSERLFYRQRGQSPGECVVRGRRVGVVSESLHAEREEYVVGGLARSRASWRGVVFTQPLRGKRDVLPRFPGVAAVRQPRAGLRNPFGIPKYRRLVARRVDFRVRPGSSGTDLEIRPTGIVTLRHTQVRLPSLQWVCQRRNRSQGEGDGGGCRKNVVHYVRPPATTSSVPLPCCPAL